VKSKKTLQKEGGPGDSREPGFMERKRKYEKAIKGKCGQGGKTAHGTGGGAMKKKT